MATTKTKTRKRTTKTASSKKAGTKRVPAKASTKPEAEPEGKAVATVTDLNAKRTEIKPSAVKGTKPETVVGDPVGLPVGLTMTAAQLAAAISCSGKKADPRHYLIGVFAHVIGGELRLASTDGHRMLVQTVAAAPADCPLDEKGIILPREQVERVLKFSGKGSDTPVTLKVTKNSPEIRLECDFGEFKIKPIDGTFPDYAKVLDSCGDVFTHERDPLDNAAIQAEYLKSAGIIGTQLGAKAVHSYQGAIDKALVFTFAGVDGAVLVQMPLGQDRAAFGGRNAALIGEAGLKGTLTALRAHETRAKKAGDDAKAASIKARIDAILDGLKGKALPAPKAAAK